MHELLIKKKNCTLQDIADFCGVSKSTVAKVIQNPENCKMRQETVTMVQEAAVKLDYHASIAARSLRTNRSYTIGVIFPNICSFYRELVIYLDMELTRRGYYPLFSYWDPMDRTTYAQCYNRLLKYGVDGIITNDDDESIPSRDVPTVIYGNELKVWDCVFPDKKHYAEHAINYLYNKGHRKIGYIGRQWDVRYQCVLDAMKKRGLEINPEWLRDSRTMSPEAYESAKALFQSSELPTALLAHSDHVAYAIIRAAAENGLKVPDDLSILSYDNLSESEFSLPPLTTYDQRFKHASLLLVDMLLRRIDDPSLPQQKMSYIMPLIERQSVKEYGGI